MEIDSAALVFGRCGSPSLKAGQIRESGFPERARNQLRKILSYHVVSGQVTAGDAVKLHSAKTLEGGSLTIRAGDGEVLVNNANMTKTGIAASNGVIKVIDTVLLPE